MKNKFYFAIAVLAGALLVSCQPALIEGPKADSPVAASELQSSFVIDGQFADAACTIPQADGNYIKYHTSPARTVQVYNTKADGSKTTYHDCLLRHFLIACCRALFFTDSRSLPYFA